MRQKHQQNTVLIHCCLNGGSSFYLLAESTMKWFELGPRSLEPPVGRIARQEIVRSVYPFSPFSLGDKESVPWYAFTIAGQVSGRRTWPVRSILMLEYSRWELGEPGSRGLLSGEWGDGGEDVSQQRGHTGNVSVFLLHEVELLKELWKAFGEWFQSHERREEKPLQSSSDGTVQEEHSESCWWDCS